MKGVVSAGDKLTAQAGAEMLKAGGNAFDAAAAALLAAPVAEPALTSLGGGGFLLAYEHNQEPVLYDFFVDVPPKRVEIPDFFPIYVDFGSAIQEFHIGSGSVATPGSVAGIFQMHQEKGKLPLIDIIEPALRYVTEGIYLSKLQASLVKLLEPIFTATDGVKKIYTKNGQLVNENTLFTNPEYAQFLKTFAKEGASSFYKGEIADAIDYLSVTNHGILRKEDLEHYKVEKRAPVNFTFKDYDIITNPPPSSGGLLIAFTLKLLENKEFNNFGSFDHLKSLIEAMTITSDFRKEHINEHLHQEGLGNILKDKQLIKNFRKSMQSRLNLWGNTTHISIIDAEGNAASVTTTNGEGSGYMIPGYGIMLNNMLGEEDLNPHGFFSWPKYVRLPSMMAPTVIVKDGEPKLVLGSAGSNRIRSAITQSIINNLIFKQDINKSVANQRIHYENGNVYIEPGYEKEIVTEIKKHYQVSEFEEKNLFFGGVNAVTNDLKGGGDPRRGGYVINI